jgi:WXG100 family type VII secretion target
MPNTRIRVDYDQLSKMITRFDAQAEQIFALRQALYQRMSDLQGGGWWGQGASAFFVEMDELLLPAVQDLENALGDTVGALREISNILQDAEEDAGRLFTGESTYSDEQPQITSGMTRHVAPSPWQGLPNGTDGGWYGSSPQEASAIVVNGIQTDFNSFNNMMNTAAGEFGGRPTMGIYNATAGTDNTWGFLQDGFQTFADKFQVATGVRIGPENPAVRSLTDAIRATGGTTPIICHSQGGAITAAALWELKNQGYDLSQLNVITMGSAEFNYPPGPRYEHRINLSDPVPMIIGGKQFDPISLTINAFRGEVGVWSNPINIDQSHSSDEYMKRF